MSTTPLEIQKTQRVFLSKPSQSYFYKIILGILLFTVSVFSLALAKLNGLGLAVFGLSFLLAVLLLLNGLRLLATFSFQNDTLIVEPVFKKAHIIPVTQIREVQTLKFLGLSFTYTRFRIDGRKQGFLGIGIDNMLKNYDLNIEEFIFKLKKKKGKS